MTETATAVRSPPRTTWSRSTGRVDHRAGARRGGRGPGPRGADGDHGPSGSGKSTLMHCLAGLDRPTSGTVVVDGQTVSSMSERRLTALRRTRVGFVFQAYNLVPTLTALENITLPLDIARRPVDRAHLDLVVQTLGLTDRLGHKPTSCPAASSSGSRARGPSSPVPAVVFADEPTGNLDSTSARRGARLPARQRRRPRAVRGDGHARPDVAPGTPTGCCSSPTAGWWASCGTRPPSPCSPPWRPCASAPLMVRVALRGAGAPRAVLPLGARGRAGRRLRGGNVRAADHARVHVHRHRRDDHARRRLRAGCRAGRRYRRTGPDQPGGAQPGAR